MADEDKTIPLGNVIKIDDERIRDNWTGWFSSLCLSLWVAAGNKIVASRPRQQPICVGPYRLLP